MDWKRGRRTWVVILAVLWALGPGWLGGPGGQTARAEEKTQWHYMGGGSSANQRGFYGPSGYVAPGAREGAVSWTDASGALWLFGGYGYDKDGNADDLNDLWKYNPVQGHWTWMKGADTIDHAGTYGTLGTPAPENNPGSRVNAVSWTDGSGGLWLFGGTGYDSLAHWGQLNDLWKYQPTTGNWTWMKGANTIGQSGIYGTQGVSAAGNTPGGRRSAAASGGPSGDLWLFGGYGCDSAGTTDNLNDLWKYTPATGNWTWVKGADKVNQGGTYGAIETPASGNTPGARDSATAWTDSSGALWLFGGQGYDGATGYGTLNDLWKYNPTAGSWTWMKGSNTIGGSAIYGTLGTPAAANTPAARLGPVSWKDSSGALWLFGGFGFDGSGSSGYLSDLWKYDPATGNWTWMKGANTTNHYSVYHMEGVPTATNTPGASRFGVSWIDASDRLWLFGGYGYDVVGGLGHLAGLLYAAPDNQAPTGFIVINNNRSVTNNPNVTLSMTWSDGNGLGVARMKTSNDGTTWTAWEALAATKAWTLATGEGYHTVRAMFRDAAGNNSIIYSDYIRLDTTPSTGSIIINSGASTTTSTKVSLGLTWSDGTGSGVVKMRFSDDGAHWSAWEPPVTPKSHTLPSPTPGYYTVRAQFLDAGNNYSPTYSDYIKLVSP